MIYKKRPKTSGPLNADSHSCYPCHTYIPVSYLSSGLFLLLNFHELFREANVTDDFMQIIENDCKFKLPAFWNRKLLVKGKWEAFQYCDELSFLWNNYSKNTLSTYTCKSITDKREKPWLKMSWFFFLGGGAYLIHKKSSFFPIFPSTLAYHTRVHTMHDTYFTVLAFIEIVSCQLIRLRVRFSVRKRLDDISRKTHMIDMGVDDPLLFSCIWIKKENGIRYIRKYCTQGEYPISCEINFGNMVLFDFF